MIKLRPYQTKAVECIKETFEKEQRQYIEMPTGSGKTVTFLSYAKEYHKKVLIIVPSRELQKQITNSALLFYEPWEISRKGNNYNEEVNDIHICIINSIQKNYIDYLCSIEFDLIIIDEAHHTQADSYKRFINAYSNLYNKTKFLGVTATPDRIDGQLINNILFNCSYKLEIYDLIKQGHLSDIEGFCVKTNIDMSDIDDHNGDFSITQLYQKLGNEKRNNLILDTYIKNMTDRKTLFFCINVQHSKDICKLLNEKGITSAHIDGKMKEEQRNSILNSFRNGEISTLCNCQLLTEGFDEPSIDGIILARPTKSRSLFTQMIGRGLRIHKGKENCKIIDIVDSHSKIKGFNSILDSNTYHPISSFKSIDDIRIHLEDERMKNIEFSIKRTKFFESRSIDDEPPTQYQLLYLDSEEIYYDSNINFDEASFLIWLNELKKEYENGCVR